MTEEMGSNYLCRLFDHVTLCTGKTWSPSNCYILPIVQFSFIAKDCRKAGSKYDPELEGSNRNVNEGAKRMLMKIVFVLAYPIHALPGIKIDTDSIVFKRYYG